MDLGVIRLFQISRSKQVQRWSRRRGNHLLGVVRWCRQLDERLLATAQSYLRQRLPTRPKAGRCVQNGRSVSPKVDQVAVLEGVPTASVGGMEVHNVEVLLCKDVAI